MYHQKYQASFQSACFCADTFQNIFDGPSSTFACLRKNSTKINNAFLHIISHMNQKFHASMQWCSGQFFGHTSKSRVQRNRLEEAGYSRGAFPSILLFFELTRLDCVQAILSQHNKCGFALDADSGNTSTDPNFLANGRTDTILTQSFYAHKGNGKRLDRPDGVINTGTRCICTCNHRRADHRTQVFLTLYCCSCSFAYQCRQPSPTNSWGNPSANTYCSCHFKAKTWRTSSCCGPSAPCHTSCALNVHLRGSASTQRFNALEAAAQGASYPKTSTSAWSLCQDSRGQSGPGSVNAVHNAVSLPRSYVQFWMADNFSCSV